MKPENVTRPVMAKLLFTFLKDLFARQAQLTQELSFDKNNQVKQGALAEVNMILNTVARTWKRAGISNPDVIAQIAQMEGER